MQRLVKRVVAVVGQLSILLQHFLLVLPQAQAEPPGLQTPLPRSQYFKALAVQVVAVASMAAQVARVAWVQAAVVAAQVRLPVVTAAQVATV